MAPPTKVAKASRITIACNACRFRKQKCSGKKPVCTQCLQHNRICDWPEQLKRGPAKGYIESLEHRLRETENVLLQVLSRISDTHLSASIAQNKQHRSRSRTGDLLYSPFPRLGKQGTEYWKKFPLNNAHDIREWQYDCLSDRRSDPLNQSLGPSTPSISDNVSPQSPGTELTARTMLGSHGQRETPEYSPSDVSLTGVHTNRHEGNGVSLSPKSTSPFARNARIKAREPPLKTVRSIQRVAEPEATGYSTQVQPNTPEGLSSIPQEPNFWSGAPPINFQQQFLW